LQSMQDSRKNNGISEEARQEMAKAEVEARKVGITDSKEIELIRQFGASGDPELTKFAMKYVKRGYDDMEYIKGEYKKWKKEHWPGILG
jgi:hypothetical protein